MTAWPADPSKEVPSTERPRRRGRRRSGGSTHADTVTLTLLAGGTSTDELAEENTSIGASSASMLVAVPAAAPTSTEVAPSKKPARSVVEKPCPCSRGYILRGREQKCPECKEDGPRCNWRSCFHCFEEKPPRAFPWGDGSKGKGIGRRRSAICQVCHDREEAEAEQRRAERRATWEEDGVVVRRCSNCKEVKPLDTSFYGVGRYHCSGCDRKHGRNYRQNMTEEQKARKRKQDTQSSRLWRKKNKDRVLASQRQYKKRLRQDPVRYQRYLEGNRMGYRLRKERREGVSIDSMRPKSRRAKQDYRTINSGPLLAAIGRYLSRYVDEAVDGTKVVILSEELLAARVGASAKQLSRWRNGGTAQLDAAQKWMNELGIEWWQVWELPTAPAECGSVTDVQRHIRLVEEHLYAAEVYSDGEPVG